MKYECFLTIDKPGLSFPPNDENFIIPNQPV